MNGDFLTQVTKVVLEGCGDVAGDYGWVTERRKKTRVPEASG